MRRRLAIIGLLLVLGGAGVLALAQTEEEAQVEEEQEAELLPGLAELQAASQVQLQLGADLGNSCICVCRTIQEPFEQRWRYFERSVISGCQWSGRLCIVEGELGRIGACTAAPALVR